MKGLLFTFMLCLFCTSYSRSAEIILVYPRNENEKQFTYNDHFDSTFVLGRVAPPVGSLTVNGTQVFYDSNGAFLAYLPLLKSSIDNAWNFLLQNGTDTLAKLNFSYKVKNDTDLVSNKKYFSYDNIKYVKISAKNTNLRTYAAGSYFVFPEQNIILPVLGESEESYKIRITEGLSGWVEKSSATIIDNYVYESPIVGNGVCSQANSTVYCSFKINRPILWSSTLSSTDKILILTLYDSKSEIERIKYDSKNSFIDDIVWTQVSDGVQMEIRCKNTIYRGYDVLQSGDSLIIKIETAQKSDKKGLFGKVIVLDAGHGGVAKGSVGPMGTMEKDATLRWAKLLKPILEKNGAIVKMTRTDDTSIGLYDRVDYAKSVNADFFLSLHFNALPDGENPYVRNGSGTYYYQSSSRFAARILHDQLLKKSELRDDGLYDASFAVIRPTSFPAVLVEAAYIIYPNEEKLINSDKFLTNISVAMTDGLKEYFKLYP